MNFYLITNWAVAKWEISHSDWHFQFETEFRQYQDLEKLPKTNSVIDLRGS